MSNCYDLRTVLGAKLDCRMHHRYKFSFYESCNVKKVSIFRDDLKIASLDEYGYLLVCLSDLEDVHDFYEFSAIVDKLRSIYKELLK